MFDLTESILRVELPDRAKHILEHYIKDSIRPTMAGRARDAIERYAQVKLPTLDEIRSKNKTSELDKLDNMILRLEYEAKRYHRPR